MSLDDSSLNQPLVNRHIVVAGLGRQRSNSWGSPADFERFNKSKPRGPEIGGGGEKIAGGRKGRGG